MSDKGLQQRYTFRDRVHYLVVVTSFFFFICVMAIFYIPLTIIITPFFKRFTKWYLWSTFRSFGYLIGLHVELEGVSKLKSAPKGVIVMNHQSIWDFYMVCSIYHHLGDTIHTVSRKEVYYMWPLGYAMYRSGSLFIDRSSPAVALKQLIAETSKILAPSNPNKSKIIIFPEGTRNKKIDGFQKFKRGAFKVAVAHNVPVIPIVCPPQTFKRHLKFFRPATVVLKCLDPVRLDPESDLDPQIEIIKSKMLVEYHKMMDAAGIERPPDQGHRVVIKTPSGSNYRHTPN